MDPLSDVLSLLKPRTYTSGGFDHGGPWSFRFGPSQGIKFYALVSGSCWLAVEGVPEPVRVEAGDCFLLPRGLPFRLASDLNLPSVNAMEVIQQPLNGAIRTLNGGGDCLALGGHFGFEATHADILLSMLPPLVRLQKESDKSAMRWTLERLMLELREPQPGGTLIAQQLATVILIQALRLHLNEGAKGGVGWLFALADKQMCAAITAMHDNPGDPWTLQTLAEHANMSRSTFALKFKQTVGTTPMEYLTRWRMMLAADKLAHSSDSLSAIATALGYESESAFSTAFKRLMGSSPRQYARTST